MYKPNYPPHRSKNISSTSQVSPAPSLLISPFTEVAAFNSITRLVLKTYKWTPTVHNTVTSLSSFDNCGFEVPSSGLQNSELFLNWAMSQ